MKYEYVRGINEYDLLEEVMEVPELVEKLIKDDEFTMNFYNTISNSLWRKAGVLSEMELMLMGMCSYDSDKWRIRMSDLYNHIFDLRVKNGKLKSERTKKSFHKKMFINDNTLETNQEIVDLMASMGWEHHKYDRTHVH